MSASRQTPLAPDYPTEELLLALVARIARIAVRLRAGRTAGGTKYEWDAIEALEAAANHVFSAHVSMHAHYKAAAQKDSAP